jgi:hypothetical protein
MEIFDLSGFMCTITGELYCNTFPSQAMKQHNISELIREVPKVRLTLATVALGMGIDAPSITRIIHVRPPTTSYSDRKISQLCF